MSCFHTLLLCLALLFGVTGESSQLGYVVLILSVFLFIDISLFLLWGASPTSVLGVLSTRLVWNFRGGAVPAIPYKVVFIFYLVALWEFINDCGFKRNDTISIKECFKGTHETTFITGIINSSLLSILRF